ncbi:hypothetical protein AB0912_15585 [Streptomyces sp. NPDC007084]|uniref:hypothetical protein n=1 Tax=Streptomyces sp. NPDC007084 TaxID=3154313 RepID=UPI0034571E16
MADSEDLTAEAIARRLDTQYKMLQRCCVMLPVPINLPDMGAFQADVEAPPAVERTAEIATEQPMPEEAQAALFTACVFWLTGMDLLGIFAIGGWSRVRAHQILKALDISQDALKSLGEWLLAQD